MILPNMTPDEIISEMTQDRDWIMKTHDEYSKSRLIDSIKKKYKKCLCVYFYRKRKTPRGNTVLFLFCLTRKKLKEAWDLYRGKIYLTENGNEQRILEDCYGRVLYYTWHFLKRYKERMIQEGDPDIRALLTNTKDLLQVLPIFYMRNIRQATSLNQTGRTRQGMSEILCITKDGMLCGTESNDGKFLKINTFLTKNMLTNIQHGRYNKAKDEQSDLYNFLDRVFGNSDWQTDKSKRDMLIQINKRLQNYLDEQA